MIEKPSEARCPVCKTRFEWRSDSPWRPFCSERCRMIDLGEWLSEGYGIADAAEEPTPFLPPQKQ